MRRHQKISRAFRSKIPRIQPLCSFRTIRSPFFLPNEFSDCAFVKNTDSQKQLVAVREVFERLIFLRMKAVYSPAEIVARTASQEWMRGANAQAKLKRKKSGWQQIEVDNNFQKLTEKL